MVASFVYFRTGYDFTKALRLGVLSGFFIALAVSLFTALFLLIMRRGKTPQKSILRRQKKIHSQKSTSHTKTDNDIVATDATPITSSFSSDDKTIEQKMMLLMDSELAFEVAFHAISDQHIGILTESTAGAGHITVKNNDEVLQITISSLTRHTSQVVIASEINSKAAKKIIQYMKEKEHSFLQY